MREDLQPDGVSRFESSGRYAFAYLPARRPFVMRGDVRRRVQPQAGNDRVGVTIARVDRDPLAAATFAVLAKLRGTDRRFQQSGGAERIGNCARTIVATISKRFVTAAENVGLAEKLVRCPDRTLYCEWGGCRSSSLAAAKTRPISRDRRTGSRKRIRVRGRNNCGQNSRANQGFSTQGMHSSFSERVLCHKIPVCKEKILSASPFPNLADPRVRYLLRNALYQADVAKAVSLIKT